MKQLELEIMMDRILRAVVIVVVRKSARFFVRANQSFPGPKNSPLVSTPIDQEMLVGQDLQRQRRRLAKECSGSRGAESARDMYKTG